MQIQPSGSQVSKVESHIAQTLSLTDAIVTLAREPVALLWQNYKKRQAMERSIGAWKKEAYDKDKECRIPVLREPRSVLPDRSQQADKSRRRFEEV